MVCNENLGVQTWAAMNIWGSWHRLQWFTHKSSCINSILGIFSFSQPLKGLFSLSRSLLRHSLLTYLYSIKDMWVHFYRLSMMFKGSLIYGLIKGSCESSFLCGWNLEHCLYIYIYPKYLIFLHTFSSIHTVWGDLKKNSHENISFHWHFCFIDVQHFQPSFFL